MDGWLVTNTERHAVEALADLMDWTRSQVMTAIRHHGGGLIQWARDEGLENIVRDIINEFNDGMVRVRTAETYANSEYR